MTNIAHTYVGSVARPKINRAKVNPKKGLRGRGTTTSQAEGEPLSYHAFSRAVNSSKSPLGSLVFTGTPSSGASRWSKLLVSSGFAILGLKGASIFLASSDCHCSFL